MTSHEDELRIQRTHFLDKYSDDDVYEAMLDGLSRLAATQPKQELRGVHWKSLWQQLRAVLALEIPYDQITRYEALNPPFILDHPDVFKLRVAVARFVGLGNALPNAYIGQNSQRFVINGFTLTERGRQAIKPVEDGPHRAGYLHRLMKSHAMAVRPEAEEVFLRLQDAANCLEFDLYRPAVVMLGIAAEVTTFLAYAAMKSLSLVSGKHEEFAARLDAIRKAQENLPDSDERRRVLMALDMIESARVMRNDAAHSGNPSPDPFLARERFGAACFHLPVVWELVIVPNLPPNP